MPEMHRFYPNLPLFSPVKNGVIRHALWIICLKEGIVLSNTRTTGSI